MPTVPQLWLELLAAYESTLLGWLVAWARVMPSVALVPAFGLRAVAAPARVGIALALAVSVAPALTVPEVDARGLAVHLGLELVRGLPVALAASAALWAATMAGGLVDELRSDRSLAHLPNLGEDATPTAALLGLLTAVAFLALGGPERLAWALTEPPVAPWPSLLGALRDLRAGVALAVAVALPLVVASISLEIAFALLARAASPAYVISVLAPIRAVVLLALTALLLDRMVELVVMAAVRS